MLHRDKTLFVPIFGSVSDCIYLQDKDKDHLLTRKNMENWFCEEEVKRKRETIQQALHKQMENQGLK
jgi:hypothetical protein